MESDPLRVLLLDDEAGVRDQLSQFLRESYGYEVDAVADGATALRRVEAAQGRYHVALIDEVLGTESGMAVLQTLKARYPDIEVILFTGWGMGAGLEALRIGAYRFFKKPFDADELALTVRFAAEYGRTRHERTLLDTMQQMMVTINSTLDLKRVLQQTCHFATELFHVEHSGMVMFFEGVEHGVLIAEHPAPTGDLGRRFDLGPDLFTTGLPADDPVLVFNRIPKQGVPAEERLVEQQEVQNIYDVAAAGEELGPVRDILLAKGIQSILIVPVVMRNRVIASFSLDSVREKRHFYPHEVELCKALARQVAVALTNAWIYEKTQRMIDALGRAIIVPAVLKEIVRSACDLFEADYALIWRYDAQRQTFLPAELVADRIPPDWLDSFRQDEPQLGQTTYQLIHGGEPYVAVPNLAYAPSDVGQSTRAHLQALQVQAFQGIRLAAGPEPLGVLYVDYKTPRLFGLQERRLLQDFAHHAALALKRVLLLDQVTRARRTARVVARASTVGDLQRTLKSVALGTQETLDCDAVVLFVYDADRARLHHPPTMVGVNHPARATGLSEVARQSLVYKLLDHNEPYIVEHIEENPDFAAARFAREEGIKSCVVVPLKAGHTVGLMFANYRTPHRFTEEELTDLRLFADMAAVAIHNAQLYARSEARAETLGAVYEAGRAITSTLTLEETLSRIADQALHLTDGICRLAGCGSQPQRRAPHPAAHGCCFSHVILIENNQMRFVAASPPEMLGMMQEKVGVVDLQTAEAIGIVGRCVRTGQPCNVGDVRDPAQAPDYIALLPSVRSQLSVPVQLASGASVVISIEHPALNAFHEDDAKNLALLAAQAAVAINNARYVEELAHYVRELERTKSLMVARTALAWMGMASSAWRHSIDGHALTIRETANLLQGYYKDLVLEPEVRRRIDTNVTRIISVAAKILEKPITPPLSSEEAVATVDINDLLHERLAQLWAGEDYAAVTLRRELAAQPLPVRISPEWFRRALDLVVANAVKAMRAVPAPELTVRTRQVSAPLGDQVEIAFRDTGLGIPPAVRDRLFRTRIEKAEDDEGLGMGLLMAQAIVQADGGDIQIGTTGPEGTTMLILLPAAHPAMPPREHV